MFNPFSEVAESGSVDAELVEQAKNGDRSALEKLVLRHQAWIYNIAVRMVFRPQDAEDVTQETLVKVVTKLSTFKGRPWRSICQNPLPRISPPTKATARLSLSASRKMPS